MGERSVSHRCPRQVLEYCLRRVIDTASVPPGSAPAAGVKNDLLLE